MSAATRTPSRRKHHPLESVEAARAFLRPRYSEPGFRWIEARLQAPLARRGGLDGEWRRAPRALRLARELHEVVPRLFPELGPWGGRGAPFDRLVEGLDGLVRVLEHHIAAARPTAAETRAARDGESLVFGLQVDEALGLAAPARGPTPLELAAWALVAGLERAAKTEEQMARRIAAWKEVQKRIRRRRRAGTPRRNHHVEPSP